MKTVEVKLFQLDELSPKAKEKARDWYKESGFDYDWWEDCYEDFRSICKVLGITLDDSRQGRNSAIFFRGFSSQGDGASFQGTYRYEKGSAKAIREYAPKDKELHDIADKLVCIQVPYFYRLTARVTTSGNYCHEYTMRLQDVLAGEDTRREVKQEDEKSLLEALRDLARWMYRTLEKEWDHLNADEQVDNAIEANDYTFFEDGSRATVG